MSTYTDTPSAEALADRVECMGRPDADLQDAASDLIRSLASERDALRAALQLAREGYASEAITGLPVLQTWRERTLARIDAALQRTAATPPQHEPTA